MNNRERREEAQLAEFSDVSLFGNWERAKQLHEQGQHGITIKTIDRALNVPPQYLSQKRLAELVHKHLSASIKRYVPEYGGIYIAFNKQVKRKPNEYNILRCRQIAPFFTTTAVNSRGTNRN